MNNKEIVNECINKWLEYCILLKYMWHIVCCSLCGLTMVVNLGGIIPCYSPGLLSGAFCFGGNRLLMPWKGVGGKGGGYSPNMIESYSNRFSGDRFAVGFLAVRRFPLFVLMCFLGNFYGHTTTRD